MTDRMKDEGQQIAASPWEPITDRLKLRLIGKLLEEAGELVSAAARCIIQGIDEKEPMTGKVNRDWLEDEIADVLSKCHEMIVRLDLDIVKIYARVEKKKKFHKPWLDGEI